MYGPLTGEKNHVLKHMNELSFYYLSNDGRLELEEQIKGRIWQP